MNPEIETGYISRRGFLAAITSAGAALIAVPAGTLAASVKDQPKAATSLAKFQEAVGSEVVLRLDDNVVKARLESVEPGAKSDVIEQFAVKFTVVDAGDTALVQGTYTLEHRKLGEQQLFLVPSGDEPAKMLTATFCRLI